MFSVESFKEQNMNSSLAIIDVPVIEIDMPKVERKTDLYLKCEEMVSIPTGMGIYTNIVFNPKGATYRDIQNAEAAGGYLSVHVEDKGGEHSSKRPHRIMSVRRERDVIIYTSKEM